MAVPIDTSQPLLRPSQLDALVRGVLAADTHDEHDWIEWKSTLDFTAANDKWHIAKQVLGFSNRTAGAARRHTGGYAYLLLGVEPGALTGVTSIDNAVLTNVIDRYVAPVRWSVEQVQVDGKKIVIIIVEPPKDGDPPFTLKKAYEKFAEGTIFVRSPGRTEQASSAQVAALVERAHAARMKLEIELRAEPATVEFGPEFDEQRIGDLIEAERRDLMRPSRPRRPSPATTDAAQRPPGAGVVGVPPAIKSIAASYQNVAAAYQGFSNFGQLPDKRSDKDYEQEVERYLDKFGQAFKHSHLHRRYYNPDASLRFVVDNMTDRNFRRLSVTVFIDGNVKRWPEKTADRVAVRPYFPTRPRALGTPTPLPDMSRAMLSPGILNRPIVPSMYVSPGFTIENTGSVTIEFDDIDVRPRTPVELPGVGLVVHEPSGTELRVQWKATAENVDGLLSGELTVMVVEQTDYYGDTEFLGGTDNESRERAWLVADPTSTVDINLSTPFGRSPGPLCC